MVCICKANSYDIQFESAPNELQFNFAVGNNLTLAFHGPQHGADGGYTFNWQPMTTTPAPNACTHQVTHLFPIPYVLTHKQTHTHT